MSKDHRPAAIFRSQRDVRLLFASSQTCKNMMETSQGTSGVYERIRDPKWLSGKGEGEGEWSSGLCDCFSDCRKVSCC
jgi:hypothetical protein